MSACLSAKAFPPRRNGASCAGAAALFMFAASPAWACFGASVWGREWGEFLLSVLFAALGVAFIAAPAVAIFWIAKALLYGRILKKNLFKDLARTHLRAFAAILAVGACYFILDGHMTAPLPTITPEGKFVRPPDEARFIKIFVSNGMLLLFFAAFYLAERKLFRNEENTPRRFRVALVVMNVVAAMVLWLVVSMYSLASCGSISSGNLDRIDARSLIINTTAPLKDHKPPKELK
jgi:hypothetical protein